MRDSIAFQPEKLFSDMEMIQTAAANSIRSWRNPYFLVDIFQDIDSKGRTENCTLLCRATGAEVLGARLN